MGNGHREGSRSFAGDGEMDARTRAELPSTTRLNELSTRLTARSDLPSVLYEMLDTLGIGRPLEVHAA
jgi:hypothetical protein